MAIRWKNTNKTDGEETMAEEKKEKKMRKAKEEKEATEPKNAKEQKEAKEPKAPWWVRLRERAVRIAKNEKVRNVTAVLGGGIAAFALWLVFRWGYSTDTTWMIGILINLLWARVLVVILPEWLEKKYRNWVPKDAEFYEEWKLQIRYQQRILAGVFAVCELIAWIMWMFRDRGGIWSYYIGNYARYYLLFFTIILQCVIAEFILIRFMLGRLEQYMARLDEFNQKTVEEGLAKALEIERTSLEKVSRSDQLRVDLIANVSHDLKTPLTSMVGYIELLKKEELSDTARDYLEVISKRAGKLKEMIESLFTLAKVSSGNVEFKKEHITINRLIEQLFADMQDKIENSGLEFVMLLAKEDTGVIADNGYMYRICQNLVENALKYSAKGTRVFVTTKVMGEPDSQKVCLELTNTAGYRMDFQKEDIVERFARADKARTTEGNGLGLAIVSTYAKALGGEFDIFIDCDQFKARLIFPKE